MFLQRGNETEQLYLFMIANIYDTQQKSCPNILLKYSIAIIIDYIVIYIIIRKHRKVTF